MPKGQEPAAGFECLDPRLGSLLPAFLEGRLGEEERARFAAHLKFCARCSEDLLLRRAAEKILRQRVPAVGLAEQRDTDERQAGLAGLFGRWQVPAFVPVALAAALLAVLLLPSRPSPPAAAGAAWAPLGERVEYFVPSRTRGAGGEPDLCVVRPGQLLEITLPKVPEAGPPILLRLEGPEGVSAGGEIPFRLVEGYPVVSLAVPSAAGGAYAATVVAGADRRPVHRFQVLVETPPPAGR